jgi:DNA-binding transcriptional LysR family regulator
VKEQQQGRPAHTRPGSDVLDLNLRSLDTFVQIAESGGMSSAARRMKLTQSAVSQIIQSLERSLGVDLFDRKVRPIALTPSGVILLEKARALLLAAREAIRTVKEPETAAFPKLNLCLVESITATIGPGFARDIQGFADLWSVHTGLPSQHSRALLAREADILLTPDPLEERPNIERYEILKEPFFIALPKDFAGEAVNLPALAAQHDLIRFSARTMMGRQVERHLERLKVDTRGRLEFDSATAILAMVTAGLGWAVITPLCALLGRAFWSEARFVPMPGPALYRRLYVVARHGEFGDIPRRIANAAIERNRKSLRNHFADYPWILEGCAIPDAAGGAAGKAGSHRHSGLG